ncbi:MAG: ArsA family ATPase [Pseudomonadota bacterium]|nr:ArsA family ATPase [Pseudomonadota bacterium]
MLLNWKRRATKPNATGNPHWIRFFGGKGGVGKTTCSSAYALSMAGAGHRTLLVSTDPAHSLSDLLEHALRGQPQQVTQNLWAFELDPHSAALRYLSEVKRNISALAAPELLKEAHRQVDLAAHSPGAEELALFEELVSTLLDVAPAYDGVVFDTAPTGHTLHLLALPELMQAWVDGLLARRLQAHAVWSDTGQGQSPKLDQAQQILNRRQHRFDRVRHLLMDPERCSFTFVMNADRLSMAETERAMKTLRQNHVPLGGVIINRTTPASEHSALMTARRTVEAGYIEATRKRLGRYTDVYVIPMASSEVQGLSNLRDLGATLNNQGLGPSQTKR